MAYHIIHNRPVKAMVLFRDPDINTMPFSCKVFRQEGTKQKTDWDTDRQKAFM